MKTIRSQYKDYHSYNSLTHTHYFALLGLITITLLSGLILTSSTTSATDDSVADEINITVPVSCTLTGTGMNSHNAEIPNGTYQADIGTTTLKAFCNDNAGFAIYAAGYTGNEIGGTNSNKLVGTASSSNATIDTGTATSAGNPDTSNWAMKLTTVSSPTPTYPITLDNGFGSYSAVPNSYTKVAHRDSNTGIGVDAEGTTLTTTYAAYISKTQAADTYSGQVIYTLVHPSDAGAPPQPVACSAGNICYIPGSSTVIGTMANQDVRAIDFSSCYNTDNEIYCYDSDWNEVDINTLPRYDYAMTDTALFASNFSRTGYGFAGWSDKYDYATNPNAHFYGPNENFTIPSDTITNGLSLYAVWIKSEGSLQDTNKVVSLCGTNGVGGTLTKAPTDGTADLTSVTALTDQRDNQTYAIARLADNKCWMIENLRLEAENTRTPEDQALAQGYGTSTTYGNFGGLADAESSNFTNSTTANSLYYSGTQSGTASIDIGTSNDPGYRMPRYNNLNTSTRASSPTSNSGNMYSYGNYYTWHAAIADLTYNGTNNQSTTGTSLCPAGWHLPKGGSSANASNSEFWQYGLAIMGNAPSNNSYYQSSETNANGDTATKALRKYPNNFLYSSCFDTSSANYRGSNGGYWSSTAYGDNLSYYLNLNSSNVGPGTFSNNKFYGRSIRCTVGS